VLINVTPTYFYLSVSKDEYPFMECISLVLIILLSWDIFWKVKGFVYFLINLYKDETKSCSVLYGTDFNSGIRFRESKQLE
jgi:hypothetical protein